jgi:hypothetical protein
MISAPRAISMPFSAASLAAMHFTSSGWPVPPEYSWVAPSARAFRTASAAWGGGP